MKKSIFCLLLFVTGFSYSKAQPASETGNVKYWVYRFTENWRNQNDSIVGWFKEENEEKYLVTSMDKLEFEGVVYDVVYHEPPLFPIHEEVTGKKSVPKRRLYSIGVRCEKGRVYTNYSDFCEYQNYRFDHDLYFLPCCWSFSDPNYLPYHLTEDGSELILYDYTMEVGDGFRHVDGHDDITVVEKDTVAYADDVPRRRLTLSNGLIIIEGMGCINSNGMLIDWLNPAEEYQSNFTYLDYCADDWNKPFNIIYTHEDSGLHVVDTNPAGIEPLQASESPSGHAIFDLQGRRLIQKPARGVYIQDGRKVVIK